MTLQECKDQIAKKYFYKNFREMEDCGLGIGTGELLDYYGEAAELYAQSKTQPLEEKLAFEIKVANAQTEINKELSIENHELNEQWMVQNKVKEEAILLYQKSLGRVRELEATIDNRDSTIKDLRAEMYSSKGYIDHLVKVHNKAVQECIDTMESFKNYSYENQIERLEKLKKVGG